MDAENVFEIREKTKNEKRRGCSKRTASFYAPGFARIKSLADCTGVNLWRMTPERAPTRVMIKPTYLDDITERGET